VWDGFHHGRRRFHSRCHTKARAHVELSLRPRRQWRTPVRPVRQRDFRSLWSWFASCRHKALQSILCCDVPRRCLALACDQVLFLSPIPWCSSRNCCPVFTPLDGRQQPLRGRDVHRLRHMPVDAGRCFRPRWWQVGRRSAARDRGEPFAFFGLSPWVRRGSVFFSFFRQGPPL